MSGVINKTLLGLLCGSLGFGVSQLTIVGDVRAHSVELTQIRNSLSEERRRTDDRIFELVGQMKDHLKLGTAILQNTESIIHQNERFLTFLSAQAKLPSTNP